MKPLSKIKALTLLLLSSLPMQAQIITNFAGGGSNLGDNGPAISAKVSNPYGGCFDANGNYYFGQSFGNPRVRMIDTNGIINTVAGNGTVGFSGDSRLATLAKFNQINGIAVDAAGNLYISDLQNYRIRRVDAITHIINTIAGNGTNGFSGDSGLAVNAALSPGNLCLDATGNIYILLMLVQTAFVKLIQLELLQQLQETEHLDFRGIADLQFMLQ